MISVATEILSLHFENNTHSSYNNEECSAESKLDNKPYQSPPLSTITPFEIAYTCIAMQLDCFILTVYNAI